MQTPEGRGVGKRVIFVDNPLRGSVSGYGSILGFGSLEKVKNHCSIMMEEVMVLYLSAENKVGVNCLVFSKGV